MEREPSATAAAPAAAALFAWVRDSASGPWALGLRGAQTLGAPGLGVGGPGARQPRSERRSGLEDPGLGAEEERAGREGFSWGDLRLLGGGVQTGGAAAQWEEPASRTERLGPRQTSGPDSAGRGGAEGSVERGSPRPRAPWGHLCPSPSHCQEDEGLSPAPPQPGRSSLWRGAGGVGPCTRRRPCIVTDTRL